MLTYLSPEARTPDAAREYPWLLLLLVFAWLWPGVFSHDLWKPFEPQLFAALGDSASFWAPQIAGQPYFDAPPVYLAVAAGFKAVLAPWATSEYSAVRFASVLFTVLGLLGSSVAGRRLWGRYHGRSVALILIGSAGLLGMAHFLHAGSVLFAAVGLLLWSITAAERQVLFSSLLFGVAMLLFTQSAGWLWGAAAVSAVLLLCVSPLWRSRRFALFLLGGILTAVPLSVLHPLALWNDNPTAFQVYAARHWWGGFGGTAGADWAWQLPYYLKHVWWFAFPALPLAVWTATRIRLRNHRAGVLALVWLAVFGSLLAIDPQPQTDKLVLLLPVLAVLGAGQLDHLRRGAVAFLNWFGIMTFGLAALCLWLGFFAVNYGVPAALAEYAARFNPYFVPKIRIIPMLVAWSFTPLWLFAITRKRIRGRQAVSNWAAGMTLTWALLLTLFLPWLDSVQSYRPVIAEAERALVQAEANRCSAEAACLYIDPKSTSAVLAWQEYGSAFPLSSQPVCRYELQQFKPPRSKLPERRVLEQQLGTPLLWAGKRPLSRSEAFVLREHLPHVH